MSRRVLHVAPWNSGIEGGVVRVAEDLAALSEGLLGTPVERVDCGTSYGHTGRGLLVRVGRNLRALARLAGRARGADAAHVHVSESGMGRDLLLGCLCAALGARTFLHLHVHEGPDAPRDLSKRLMLRLSARLVTRAFFLTRATARAFTPLFGVRSSWFHNFTRMPEELQPEAKEPLVLFLGRMDPRKGLDELLDAAPQLHDAGWRLELCGSFDPARPDHERAVRARLAELPGAVWRGRVDGERKDDVLRRASVLVLPSHTEVFPVVLVEGAGWGCALVATDVGEVGELIEDGANGLLVPARDGQALAAALREVTADPARRERLARAARRDALEGFSDRAMARRLERIYRDTGILG